MDLIATNRMTKSVLLSFFDERHNPADLQTSARAMSEKLAKPDPLNPMSKVNAYAKPKTRSPAPRKDKPVAQATQYGTHSVEAARAAIFD